MRRELEAPNVSLQDLAPDRSAGTVTVPAGVFFCMTTWLPRLRTSSNPDFLKTAQTSFPKRTRNLANRYLDLSDENFVSQPLLDFGG